MKKSYLALGLVAAVAMSSCSNDEPMPNGNGNQSDLTKGLQPVVLSMTTTSADVNVSTRGTGTVGSTDPAENNWQFEDIYVLMTSSDPVCLMADDVTEVDGEKSGWGFTSVNGKGPFLWQQFNGTFWSRPYVKSETDGVKTWGLDYKIDDNEWWDGAPIDKFYPQTGKSNFFAFYIDDACSSKQKAPFAGNNDIPAVAPNTQAFSHEHPIYTKTDDNTMTVEFEIDGSQDLMFGTTNNIDKTYQSLGYSAQSARAGVVPSITMNHLLSRLVFSVIRGAASTDMVQLDSIEVLSESTGTMVVAYENEVTLDNILTWTEDQEKKSFFLKEKAPAGQTPKVDTNGYLLDENDAQILYELTVYEYDDLSGTYVENGEEQRPILYQGVDENGDFKLAYNDGRPHMSPVRILPGTPDYTNIFNLIQYETVVLDINDPKPFLQKFTPIALKELIPGEGDEEQVGEAMFVKPQAEAYTMKVHMTMTLREAWTDDEDNEHEALTEGVVLELPLKVDDGFVAGKSYNVRVTVYGLEKVEVEVVLSAWENGGDISVGADDEYDVNGDPVTPTPAP